MPRSETVHRKTPRALLLLLVLSACCPLPQSGTDRTARASIRFGLVADIQYATRPAAGARDYRQSLARLESCIDDWNEHELDFAVQLGDAIDGESSLDATTVSLQRVLGLLERSRAPVHHVVGNHDLTLPRRLLLERLGMQRGYDTFALSGWRFVILDTMDVSLQGFADDAPQVAAAREWLASHPPASSPNAQPWNGAVGGDQLEWLRSTLRRARASGERVIVFSHHPLLETASEPAVTAWNATQIRSVLSASGVVAACFAGHHHAGGEAIEDDILYVTLKGLVEAPLGSNAYAIIELSETEIRIEGHGTEPGRVLTLQKGG